MSDAVKRANDLLRLAAPSSRTTESERISAALEAAKMVAENNLVVVKIEHKRLPRPQSGSSDWTTRMVDWAARHATANEQDGFFKRTRPRNPWSQGSAQNWNEIYVVQDIPCIACGKIIYAGDKAWFDFTIGWRHHDITCDQKSF